MNIHDSLTKYATNSGKQKKYMVLRYMNLKCWPVTKLTMVKLKGIARSVQAKTHPREFGMVMERQLIQ